ncbi:hypothetical protein H4582DRAFT_1043212 [Lactarius indigo]|nr:hypothetical protein H4582DRAFT_1043212 [Lactarius indigo]
MRSAWPRMLGPLSIGSRVFARIVLDSELQAQVPWTYFPLTVLLTTLFRFLGSPVAPRRPWAACGHTFTVFRPCQQTLSASVLHWGLCPFHFSLCQRTIVLHKIRAP